MPPVMYRFFVQYFTQLILNLDPIFPKPHIYCELGVSIGKTFNLIAPLVDKAYAVDMLDIHDKIKHNSNLVWFHGKTDEFFEYLKKNPETFSVVFIDTDVGTQKDFDSIFPYVRDNGFILIHDTYPESEKRIHEWRIGGLEVDAFDTAWHIRTNYNNKCEIVTIPISCGLSIIRKANRQILWKEATQ